MRIVFMGTPEFAVPSLRALVEGGHQIAGVFTQPDKPKNRGMKLQPTPVKEYALTQKIPVYQPEKLRDGMALSLLRVLAPELVVVAAYGRILPRELLELPPLGCINVHSSLLPKYRGAAPIHWAVLNGEKETGVTIMHMAEELDAGDIISQRTTPIDPEETVEALHDRLALLGADLLTEAVAEIGAGTATRTPQDAEKVSFAPMLSRALSPMDWEKPAAVLHDQVRGLVPWPGAVAQLCGREFKVWKTKILPGRRAQPPGTILERGEGGLQVACGQESILLIEELQAQGKRRMAAADYLRGNPLI